MENTELMGSGAGLGCLEMGRAEAAERIGSGRAALVHPLPVEI